LKKCIMRIFENMTLTVFLIFWKNALVFRNNLKKTPSPPPRPPPGAVFRIFWKTIWFFKNSLKRPSWGGRAAPGGGRGGRNLVFFKLFLKNNMSFFKRFGNRPRLFLKTVHSQLFQSFKVYAGTQDATSCSPSSASWQLASYPPGNTTSLNS